MPFPSSRLSLPHEVLWSQLMDKVNLYAFERRRRLVLSSPDTYHSGVVSIDPTNMGFRAIFLLMAVLFAARLVLSVVLGHEARISLDSFSKTLVTDVVVPLGLVVGSYVFAAMLVTARRNFRESCLSYVGFFPIAVFWPMVTLNIFAMVREVYGDAWLAGQTVGMLSERINPVEIAAFGIAVFLLLSYVCWFYQSLLRGCDLIGKVVGINKYVIGVLIIIANVTAFCIDAILVGVLLLLHNLLLPS